MKHFINTLIIFSISLFSLQAYAHPHIFIDVQPHLTSVQKDKTVVSLKWFFDEFTSEGLILDHDDNKNGTLEDKEKQIIMKDLWNGLKKFNYFTEIVLNKKRQKFTFENFQIKTTKSKSKENSQMVTILYYQFDVIIKGKAQKDNELSISFYDETLFSVLYPKEKMTIDKKIKAQSNVLKKEECLFKVGFKL